MSKEYQPYTPTKWESRIDKALGLVSTRTALNRMVAREKMNWFRYLAAQPTSSRPNSTAHTAGEWLRIQREKLQVMWNAIDMVDNSGLCSGILIKFPTYVCGTLSWQARTGDKNVNSQYQQYIKDKTTKPGNIDVTRRFTLRQMCMLDVKCIALKGDVGTNIIREGDESEAEIYLQGIEANRIGDPYRYQTSQTYVRGLVLDSKTAAIKAVQVFYQDKRSGTYRFDDTYNMRDERGLPKFLFFTNPIPISYDDYRGVSLFKHAIDNATYIDRMRQYELQALLWAASYAGVFHTKSGLLPDSLPFDRNRLQDKDGNFIDTYEVRPNTVTALSEGEDVTMFQHSRPSPNIIGMYENTVRDIAIGAGLTYGFTYDMTGLTGPAVRQCSAQDARSIQIWQEMLREQKLDQVVMLILGEAIARGDLPYHPNWLQWSWFFPAKPTIDVGRESEADINEVNAVLNTGAMVVADGGRGDIEDIITQRSHEVQTMIEAAMKVAKTLKLEWQEVYAMMVKTGPKGAGGGAMKSAEAAGEKVDAATNRDKPGATDDGVDLEDEERYERNGHGPLVIQNFYDPSQARDKSGKFEDEGKGSQEPGYVHPGEGGGGTATKKAADKKEGPYDIDYVPPKNVQKRVGPYKGPKGPHDIDYEPPDKSIPKLTGLDKKISDYKPDRSLADPSKTVRLDQYLPDVKYTSYSQTPFFRRVNALQGTLKPDEIDVGDFVKSRDEVFDTLPTTKLSLDNVVVTQPAVNKDRVQEIIDKPETGGTKPIQAVKFDGHTYILNGHHRVAALLKEGKDKNIEARVLDLDHPQPKPPVDDADVDRYTKELATLPEYKTVSARLNSYNTDPVAREHWTAERNMVDGKYTPERKAIHEKIVNNMLKGSPVQEGERPQAVFLMGKPAAGKTMGAGKYISGYGNSTTLSADDMAAQLPEFKGWNRPLMQSETKELMTDLTARAIAERHNLVYDEVGGNLTKLKTRAETLTKAGYDVHIIHVKAPMSQTAPLTWQRFLDTGRFTDPSYVQNDVDSKPDYVYEELKKDSNIKSWREIDNKDFRGKVIDEGNR